MTAALFLQPTDDIVLMAQTLEKIFLQKVAQMPQEEQEAVVTVAKNSHKKGASRAAGEGGGGGSPSGGGAPCPSRWHQRTWSVLSRSCGRISKWRERCGRERPPGLLGWGSSLGKKAALLGALPPREKAPLWQHQNQGAATGRPGWESEKREERNFFCPVGLWTGPAGLFPGREAVAEGRPLLGPCRVGGFLY